MASVRIIGILCSEHLETSQWSVAGRCLSLSVVEFGLVRTTLNSAGIARQQSVGVDALELYRPKPFFRLQPASANSGNTQKTGFSAGALPQGFWPPSSRGPLCPSLHARSADVAVAAPRHARIRGQARLE